MYPGSVAERLRILCDTRVLLALYSCVSRACGLERESQDYFKLSARLLPAATCIAEWSSLLLWLLSVMNWGG